MEGECQLGRCTVQSNKNFAYWINVTVRRQAIDLNESRISSKSLQNSPSHRVLIHQEAYHKSPFGSWQVSIRNGACPPLAS